jgi:hypothetical protein
MHPELLRALGKARHDDLLNRHHSRQPRVRLPAHAPRLARFRQRVGMLLIRAGARLLGDQRDAPKLAHE